MDNSNPTNTLIKKNKILKISLIVTILLFVFSLSFIAFLISVNIEPTTKTFENEVPKTSIDLNLGSNIVLSDMSYITSIGISEENEEHSIAGGIINIKKDVAQNTVLEMDIINKYRINSWTQESFEIAYDDILNNNMSAHWLETGSNPPFATSISPAIYNPLVEINVEYPNTDYTFALLSLSNGQEYAQANDTSPNFEIFVFATKNDNIIRLKSNRNNLIEDMLLTEEESMSCTKVDDTYGEIYDVDCLKEVYNSGTYDDALEEKAQEIIRWFEFKE